MNSEFPILMILLLLFWTKPRVIYDRLVNSEEIRIGVKDNMKNISLELTQENKVGQFFWILVSNKSNKIIVGVTTHHIEM